MAMKILVILQKKESATYNSETQEYTMSCGGKEYVGK